MKKSLWRAALSMLLFLGSTGTTPAWTSYGHRWISGIAVEKLPDSIPAFVRSRDAIRIVTELGPEADRSKSAGQEHDAEFGPGHYVDIADDGTIGGTVSLSALPATREMYDTALRQRNANQYRLGYLPYSIIEGWQQVRKDFANWRMDTVGARRAESPADRAWFEKDRRMRELLTIHDIGVWSHYVADASQPLHVSVHFNGWGDYPNPMSYSTSQTLHARFEGEFVRKFVDRSSVASAVGSYRNCNCTIEQRTAAYLAASLQTVVPLYELEAKSGFDGTDPRGRAFVTGRLATGAAELRDMIVDAWESSADAVVWYPVIKVRDIEEGRALPKPASED